MTDGSGQDLDALLSRVAAALTASAPGAAGELSVAYAQRYFRHAPPEDLLDDDAVRLAALVRSQLEFARRRTPGTPSIRVFVPRAAEHGWECAHTVVEVVTDDMPFLVDSVTMALNRRGLTVQRLFHPVIGVLRGADGTLAGLAADGDVQQPAPAGQATLRESTMHFEVDPPADAPARDAIQAEIARALADVRATVEDWQPMRARLLAAADGDELARAPMTGEDLDEVRAFLRWLADDHFTFVGYRRYEVDAAGAELALCAMPGSGLGILRNPDATRSCRSFSTLPAEQRAFALGPTALIVNKASAQSTVHRPARLDYVGVKRFDAQGRVIGEHRFLGLLSSAAYSARPVDIPLLRRKTRAVLRRAGFPADSHAGKALRNVIDAYPRDELLQADEDELFRTCIGIVHIGERRQVRLFARRDPFGRFVSCLVFVPRDRYTTALRLRIQEILLEALCGHAAEFAIRLSDSVLARVQFTIHTAPGAVPQVGVPALEARLREALLTWDERLAQALVARLGEARGGELSRRYEGAFGAAYQADFAAGAAVDDLLQLEALGPGRPLGLHLHRGADAGADTLQLRAFGTQPTIALSDMLPLLENMGMRVLTARPYEIATRDGRSLWIVAFDLRAPAPVADGAQPIHGLVEEAILRIWQGDAENDGFNRLVVAAGLDWREVWVLRAYCRYLLQVRMPFSQAYVEKVLLDHAPIAGRLVALFRARFDPDRQDRAADASAAIGSEIARMLERVESLDDDRILRGLHAAIDATLRTSFFRTLADGAPPGYLSFKLDPRTIPGMPLPRPMAEIWVCSPRVEAVHLRGGPVARGGLRWSDRREDFRTEVLGLLKAQMVKNAVIVPVGSKGGFVVRRMPQAGEAVRDEVLHCYRSMIRGMLDLTDNLVDGAVVAPPRVVRRDGDDPYLVVAADKGTASFSDVANAISREYGFWLGDAFASGGSAGYDHKRMGITARGAWESVKRHFRELGMDIAGRDDFTVAGIGDMSGDVFGNGMLLSPHIRLVAAFDHRHVFLDPDPDPRASLAERRRLFALPRSCWADYDPALISAGGGVFARTQKSIPLSTQAQRALGVSAEAMAPPDLIRAILRAPVDLLWNGGIGTYVKARDESHADVGDRANDAVRIDGHELRARVVGEGGNLGFTQRGRIECAQHGVRILTDAIDNSAGVNCSDHEVNIKILLAMAVRGGELTGEERDRLLAAMTDEVASLVLRENYLQPQSIALERARAAQLLPGHAAMIRALERQGRLDRALEALPDEDALRERESAGQGLTAPEIAVLLAYGKIALFERLVTSDAPEDPFLHRELAGYFPRRLRERFAPLMDRHPLRRQIVCTRLANEMLDRMGPGFAFRTCAQSGEDEPALARAYAAAREIFDARSLWEGIEALDDRVDARELAAMHAQVQRLVGRASLWLLRNRRPPLSVEATVGEFRDGIRAVAQALPGLLAPAERGELVETAGRLARSGVPDALADRIAGLDWLYCALDVVEIAHCAGAAERTAAHAYFGLFGRLGLSWLREAIHALPAHGAWQERARAALLDALYGRARELAARVLAGVGPGEADAARAIARWLQSDREGLARCEATLAELRAAGQPDLAMLSVALGELAALAPPH